MQVILSQINPVVGDIKGNTLKIVQEIEAAKKRSVELVVFPELATVGYPPQDFLLMPQFINEAEKALHEIVRASSGIAVIVGVIRENKGPGEKKLFNSAAVIENGVILGFQDKSLLPTYDVFDERRFFEPASTLSLFTIAGSKVGVTICEDIWQHSESLKYSSYTLDPVKKLASLNPDLVVNLSASPFSLDKFRSRLAVCLKAAKTLKCPLMLCNQVGGNDSLIFDGRSLYINNEGVFAASAKAFQEDRLMIDTAEKKVEKDLNVDPIQELYEALVLALRDYFYKSGFKKACLGLSGGIDSAVVACLAADALGSENVLGVLMPSRYSSEGSLKDALALAKSLKIQTNEISVEGPFKAYLELMEPVFEVSGKTIMDATEENMQARIRGMILMSLSNKFGFIVLSTGNKSELAMGYATLYGDMCGGVAVISDVTKELVYKLAEYINRKIALIPLSTITKAPSAELRPNQKDSDSLPDYSVIDNVLEAYVERYESPYTIAKQFGYPIALVQDLVSRIHRNEYKRRQGPLGFRVTEKAFSAGRYFPIVQKYVM